MIYISEYLDIIICFENPTLLIYIIYIYDVKSNKERFIYLKENALSIYASLRMRDKISIVEFFLRLKNLSIQQIFEVLKSCSKGLHLYEEEERSFLPTMLKSYKTKKNLANLFEVRILLKDFTPKSFVIIGTLSEDLIKKEVTNYDKNYTKISK
jgi:hypothetical protein